MIFAVSTCAFRDNTLREAINFARRENFILEFSSGLPYDSNMVDTFLKAEVKKMPHNYFPAPKKPFVLNLASSNPEIREKSIDICIQGIKLANQVEALFYAAHAGFCIDPDFDRLGKPLGKVPTHSKDYHWELFINSLDYILKITENLNTHFLIENNVIASYNLLSDGSNPLLCCSADEMLEVNDYISDDRFGLLLDTAHLKVSANTLHFSAEECVKQIMPFVKGIHHSDNDGKADTNSPINREYWFLPLMHYFPDLIHVLEVNDQSESQILLQKQILEKSI